MKKLTLMLLVAAIFLLPEAVIGQITFQKTYGSGTGYCVIQLSDGNMLITGELGGNAFLLKMDQNGNMIWFKSYNSLQGSVGNSVIEAPDGGYAIGGTFDGINVSKVLLLKTDSNGNLQWVKTYGGTKDEWGNGVISTLDGGYALVGNTKSFGTNFDDIYVIKTDSDGNLQWSRDIADSPTDDVNYGKAIVQSADSGFAICGRLLNTAGMNGDMGLIKLDKDGNLIWAKSYGDSFSDDSEDIIVTADGGYALVGYTESFGNGSADVFLVKTDSDGILQWNIAYGGTNYDDSFSVKQLINGDYVVGGRTQSFGNGMVDFYLTKFDSNQIFVWTKTFGGTSFDHGYSVAETPDKGFLMSGFSPSFGPGDICVVKTDSAGYSGCNEFMPTIGMSFASAIVTTPSIAIISPSTVVGAPSFTVSNISTVNTLCSLVSVPEVDPEQIIWENLKLICIRDMLGRRVNQVYPNNIYQYEYIDDKERPFYRMVGIK